MIAGRFQFGIVRMFVRLTQIGLYVSYCLFASCPSRQESAGPVASHRQSVTIMDSFSSELLSCSMSVGVIVTICWIRRKIFTKQIWYSVVSLEHSRGRLLLRQNAGSIHFSLFSISSVYIPCFFVRDIQGWFFLVIEDYFRCSNLRVSSSSI